MSIQFPRPNTNSHQAGPGMGRSRDFAPRRNDGPQRQGGWGQDNAQFGRREMHHGRHGGHEAFGGRDHFQRSQGQRPQIDPAQRAEDFFTRFDTNKDGSVTQDEVQAYFQAEAVKRRQAPAPADTTAPVVATPEADSPTVDASAPLVTPSTDTTSTDTTAPADDSQAIDPATAQTQVLAQLEGLAQQDGLTDDQKAAVTKAHDDVTALDPADAEFMTKLQTALGPLMGADA